MPSQAKVRIEFYDTAMSEKEKKNVGKKDLCHGDDMAHGATFIYKQVGILATVALKWS